MSKISSIKDIGLNLPVYASIAELKNAGKVQNKPAVVLGYGLYIYDSTDVNASDDIIYVAPNLGAGNWILTSFEFGGSISAATKIHLSGTQSFATSAWTKIQFDAISFDDLGQANTTTNEITIKKTGKYILTTGFNITDALDNIQLGIQIVINSTVESQYVINNGTPAETTTGHCGFMVSRTYYATEGDVLYVNISAPGHNIGNGENTFFAVIPIL